MRLIMNIIGQKNILKYIDYILKTNNLAHNYLFYGQKHLGKETLAKKFSQAVLCSKRKGSSYCSDCLSCQYFSKHIHPDFFYLTGEGKSSLGIDQIRNLKQFFNSKPVLSKYKVALIVQGDKMTLQAFNALLKLFEEPPPYSLIIITANDLTRFPLTVLSRAQVLRFSLPDRKQILSWLEGEKRNIQDLALLLFLSSAQPGMIIQFLEDKSKINSFKESISKSLSVLKKRNLENTLSYFQGNKSVDSKFDHLIWALRIALYNKLKLGDFLPDSFKKEQVDFSLKDLYFLIQKAFQSKIHLEQNVNPNLVVGDFCLYLDKFN